MKHYVLTFLKGLFIGSTMLVPGVSGGSMAMILGIYDHLITSVSNFRKERKANSLFLACFVVSALTGMIIFARPILLFIERYPFPMLYFFIGLVAGSIPMILKKAKSTSWNWKVFVFPLLGGAVVWMLSLLPTQQGDAAFQNSAMLLVAGVISAIALVLPGISVSYMLLLLGMYDTCMQAIAAMDVMVLLPMAIGGIVGILLTVKMLEKLLRQYPQITYLFILGFILGSVVEIFPGIPQGSECIISFCLFFVGAMLVWLLSKLDKA